MSQTHDFNESLAKSHSASDLPIWEEVYRKAFPAMLAMVDHRQDGEHQRAGIDRSVILVNSKQLLIDEKVRFKDYGDILIEFISNDQRQTPGWAEKDLRCDYIAYAVIPSGRCFVLPVPQLQLAWKFKRSEWIDRFGTRAAKNNGYRTINCPVPVNVLFSAITKAMTIVFDNRGLK